MPKRSAAVTSHYICDAAHAAAGQFFGPKVIAAGVLNTYSEDWREAAEEMNDVEKAYHGRGQPSDHIILSWQEGERPTPEQMAEAVAVALRHAGYGDQPAVWCAHGNTGNIHIHVNVLRIEMDDAGRLRVPEGRATIRKAGHDNVVESLHVALAEICRDQGWRAEEYARYGDDLQRSPRTKSRDKDEIRLRPRLQAAEAHSGQPHPIRRMGESARDILRAANSWPEANRRLAQAGIKIDVRPSGEGAVLTGKAGRLKLSALPPDCGLKALQDRLGDQVAIADFHRAAATRRARKAKKFIQQRNQGPYRVAPIWPEDRELAAPEPEGEQHVDALEDNSEGIQPKTGVKFDL